MTTSALGTILVRSKMNTQNQVEWRGDSKHPTSAGKILLVRDSKLTFDINGLGKIEGTTNVADGKEHEVGLKYETLTSKFTILVDGKDEG